MKKRHFKTYALLGLTSGLLAASALNGAESTAKEAAKDKKEKEDSSDPNSGNYGYYLMTEEDLLDELNDEGVKTYNSLSPEGKQLALKVASARCDGTNECKGLNACKTDKNDCAGKGSCKGTSKCALSDKNLAVKLVAKKMGNKRAQTLQSH